MAKRKLTRDTDNKMVAGVASGLSKYFNIDVTIIRLGFVATTILWGSGFWIYLALWLLAPTEDGEVIIDISRKDEV